MHLVHWYISVFHGFFALVLCTSIRPASLLCRKPRSELSGSGGEIPLTQRCLGAIGSASDSRLLELPEG